MLTLYDKPFGVKWLLFFPPPSEGESPDYVVLATLTCAEPDENAYHVYASESFNEFAGTIRLAQTQTETIERVREVLLNFYVWRLGILFPDQTELLKSTERQLAEARSGSGGGSAQSEVTPVA